MNSEKIPHASGGFDFWLVPNQGSPVLDKAGNQRLRKHMKADIRRLHIIYNIGPGIPGIKQDGMFVYMLSGIPDTKEATQSQKTWTTQANNVSIF